MIDMDTRSLLTDALTPPAGSQFDCGVATTYSLDLVTLLGLPLHLAWMGNAHQTAEDLDLLPLLEALRRTAGRLTVFCQRARIQVPRRPSPVLGLLEAMVHEVMAPHGGVFHPKVWLLRFRSNTNEEPLMRLLVLSRNLTDDRSWDVALKLEGSVGKKPKRSNQPLARFLEHTIGSANKEVPAARAQDLQQLLQDASCCEWQLPGRFDELRFHALGIASKPKRWMPTPDDGEWDELGVISPFVGQRALEQLRASAAKAPFLIARSEELDKLADPLAGFEAVRVLSDQAAETDEEDEAAGRERGLHAKVFVGKRGWNTHLFVGSANATEAALLAGHNVEFMAELIGRCSKVGRPCEWLGDEGLGPALLEYVKSEPSNTQEDLTAESLLEQARSRLASAGLTLACVHAEGGWKLMLRLPGSVPLAGIQAAVWPITLRRERGVILDACGGEAVDWGLMAKQDLTSIVAFGLVLGDRELTFALDLPIEGMPADRDLEILRSALKNREGFLRYLLLLLGEWDPGSGQEGVFQWRGKALGGAAGDEAPVFELLARAYAREPQRLTQVKQVIERLAAEQQEPGSGDEPVLPPEFLQVWSSFEQAMREDAQ